MNCFAFRKNLYGMMYCDALESMDCKGCNFYKSEKQRAKDDKRTWDRLEKMGYCRGEYPLRFKEVEQMKLDDVIYQLRSLKEHCKSQCSVDEDDIWNEDVEALEYAIERLGKEKDPMAIVARQGLTKTFI